MAASPPSADSSTEESWYMEDEDSDAPLDSPSEYEERSYIYTRQPGLRERAKRTTTLKQQREYSPKVSIHTSTSQASTSTEPSFIMPSMTQGYTPSNRTSRTPTSNLKKTPSPKRGKSSRVFASKKKNDKDSDQVAAELQDSTLLLFSAVWNWVVLPPARYMATVVGIMIKYTQPLVALVVTLWICFYLLHRPFSAAYASTVLWLCQSTTISWLEPAFCSAVQPSPGPVEFDQLMTVQSAFEDVLSSSAGSVNLPFDMKRGEASVRDLRQVVQFSSLPSRHELVFEFSGFIETARQASTDLTRFNAGIGRAVDHVLSTNKWTLSEIQRIAEREASRGSVGRFLQDTLFSPFQSSRLAESLLLSQYLRHTALIEEEIAKLIVEAQALLGILQNLDDRLDAIHSITTRDGVKLKGTRDELLGQLWTWIGGNRSTWKKNTEQLKLLQDVSTYRKTAWAHVSATVLKLQAISAGLEDLRERVGSAETVGMREDVPLSMHIEHIQLGVERLESQREQSRRVEGDHHRRVLDGASRHDDVEAIEGRAT